MSCDTCLDLGYTMPERTPCPACQPELAAAHRRVGLEPGKRAAAAKRAAKVDPDRVPVGPFQAEVARRVGNGESLASLAAMAGFTRESSPGGPDGHAGARPKTERGDVSRFQRVLGLKAYSGGASPNKYVHKTLPYERAVELCRALDIDPVDVGV